MIKANELRIGNYVYLEDKSIFQIKKGSDIDNSDKYAPIPINGEWLLKLGFRHGSNEIEFDEYSDIVIFWQENESVPSDMCEPERYYPIEYKDEKQWFTDTYMIGVQLKNSRNIDDCYAWVCGDEKSLCTNVHEFQNLLFIFSGEDLIFSTEP